MNAERARIAREHDVIGDSISVMGVQAGAVRRVLPSEVEEERETRLWVERTGRGAVTEMQRLLHLLREQNGAPSGALPDLAQVPRLVEDMRGAGLVIELETEERSTTCRGAARSRPTESCRRRSPTRSGTIRPRRFGSRYGARRRS